MEIYKSLVQNKVDLTFPLMKNIFVFVVAIFLMLTSCTNKKSAPAEGEIISSPEYEKIDSLLNDFVDKQKIQGAVALVAHEGKIVYHQAVGYSNIEEAQAQTIHDIFRIASMTKQITSLAAMILYDQGKFQLDDPLSKYIPEFREMQILDEVNMSDSTFTGHPAKREITIRQLFTHSSGIGYGFQDEKLMALIEKAGITEGFEQGNIILAENIKALAKIPLIHEPGERFTYGLNMDVLGRLVEIWSNQPLDQFFKENIFDPLGMDDSYFYLPEDKYSRLIDVYASTEQGIVKSKEPFLYPVKGAKTYLSGGADLNCTAYDYYLFCQMMLNGGELKAVRILKPATVKLMTETHLETGDYDMGLGFSVLSEKTNTSDARSAGSFSGGGYFGTAYWIDPDTDLIAILMLQIYPFEHPEIYKKFEDLIYENIRIR